MCVDGDMVQGVYSETGSYQGKLKNQFFTKGRYFGAGQMYGGYRVNNRQFTRGEGTFNMTLSSDGMTLERYARRRGQGDRAQFLYLVYTLVTKTITDRVLMCGMINMDSTTTMNGAYMSTTSENITTEICYDAEIISRNGGMVQSFSYWTANETMAEGIAYGSCQFNGQICGADFFSVSEGVFGTELLIKLADDRLWSSIWLGTTPQIVNLTTQPEWHMTGLWEPAVMSAFNTCLDEVYEVYNPQKCSNMTNEFCWGQEMFGLCHVEEGKERSSGSACYKTKFV
jgi:hypothetical protein